MANEPVRPRVMAFLSRQDGFVHVGGIARGAEVSANSVRTVLRELEQAGRLETRPTGDMPGPTGAGYRLHPGDPARETPRGAATAAGTWTIYTPEGEYAVTAANIHMALGTWGLEHHVNAAQAGVLAVVSHGMQPPLVIADNADEEDAFMFHHHARPSDYEDAGTRSHEEEE
jgi:hypothetical protein